MKLQTIILITFFIGIQSMPNPQEPGTQTFAISEAFQPLEVSKPLIASRSVLSEAPIESELEIGTVPFGARSSISEPTDNQNLSEVPQVNSQDLTNVLLVILIKLLSNNKAPTTCPVCPICHPRFTSEPPIVATSELSNNLSKLARSNLVDQAFKRTKGKTYLFTLFLRFFQF